MKTDGTFKAKRFGTAVAVTLTYDNLSGEEQQHSFNLYVNSDRFILEPQWPTDELHFEKPPARLRNFPLCSDA